ncbi:TetR/AcrR family transcriptional regulator [Amycolatopsis sp. NBC_01480]|uniref:TetR/AcrR family transcriptional regulator n=1 Tax=Amycolatopsis sp. NBC_01480 TaxID=2903562 RepID=UPI002E2944F1|nr:TetR/AcrR family transcriptional regulator [Amycolatopsis sp. NBC_01480]
MASDAPKPYHHGHLRQALIDAAVAEVEAVGPAALSLREIARRAGVSHGAPAHHFRDKAGVFTAIATEAFRLAGRTIGPVAQGPYGFLDGGSAYIGFALAHPGHFAVMLRPDLYHDDDPELSLARDEAFQILYGSAADLDGLPPGADVTGLVLAGWSLAHGFATLWLNGNLKDRTGPAPADVADQLRDGVIRLGRALEQQRGDQ